MSAVYLAAAVVINVLPWLLNRRIFSGKTDQARVGIFISFTVALSALVALFATGEQGFAPVSIICGVVQGISFAVGYCILILRALEIGPIAMTTLFNNMGLLGPTLVGLVFFSAPARSPLLLALGFALVIFSMIAASVSSGKKQEGEGRQATRRWFVMAFFGWLFSFFSMSANYISSQLAPECVYSYMVVTYGTSTLILIAYALWKHNLRPSKAEIGGGLILGLCQVINVVVTFAALALVPSIVFYPIAIATPIFVIMLMGRFFYKDPMDKTAWVSVVLGFIGVLILAFFS